MEYKEILRLKEMLEKANIPYDSFLQISDGYGIRLNANVDAVQHQYSYGGEQGKLEMMGGLTIEEKENDSVKGWLSAEEVFKRFKYCYENNTSTYDDGLSHIWKTKKAISLIEEATALLPKTLSAVEDDLIDITSFLEDKVKEWENDKSNRRR